MIVAKKKIEKYVAFNSSWFKNDRIWLAKFKYVQSSESTAVHKPDPNVFLPIVDLFKVENIDKKQILYIGDSLDDYYSSTGIGIHFIGIADGSVTYDAFRSVTQHVIRNLHEIEDILSIERI